MREATAIAGVWQRHYCGTSPARVLDIGCGLAAVDVFLWRTMAVESIALLDGSAVGRKDVYTDGSRAWNDVSIGCEVVNQNTTIRARGLYPTEQTLPHSDLIISLRSWCHHYPAAVYLDRVTRALAPGGILICDCRIGMGNYETLAQWFAPIAHVEWSPKRLRVAWRLKDERGM